MFQSAPTIVCAASSWLRSTIARYEVETTSSPIASSSRSAAAKPAPGRAPEPAARQVDGHAARPSDPAIEPMRSTNSSRRSARNEAANSSSVGASSTRGSIVPAPGFGFVPPRSWMNAKMPTGSTNSSTGTRDSSGRSSRESARRSSSTVREM